MALHPPEIMGVLNVIKDVLNNESIVLSLAPKITIGKMSELLPTKKLVRMIPNATSFISKGINPVHFHESFSDEERVEFMKMFAALGNNFEVVEQKLEGYAIVSAMLPTYF